jgi:hypothetical protein
MLRLILITISLWIPKFASAAGDNLLTRLGESNPLPYDNIDSLLQDIPSMLVGISTIVFMVMFVYGGYMYFLSQGDEATKVKAMKTLVWAVIGLICVGIAYSLILFVKGKLE